MKLIRFEASNIFSLGKVELDLEKRGLLLITGYSEDEGHSNGAGKSSLASKGITWTIFGQIPDDMKADEVVNRHATGKSGYGQVTFNDFEGRLCSIVRKRGSKNTLQFFIDGKEVSQRKKDTQELINRTIGRDFQTFIQSDFFGQGREMSYASLTPKQQKEILEQILPIEDCDKWAEYAKEQYKALDERVEEKEREVHTTSVKLQTLKNQHENILDHSKGWEATKNEKIVDLTTNLNKEEDRIKAVQQEIKVLEVSKEKYTVFSEKEVNKIINTRDELAKNQVYLESEKEKAHTIYMQWKNALRQYKYEIGALESKIENSVCPKCDRPITKDFSDEIKSQIKSKDLAAAEAERNMEEATRAYNYWGKECRNNWEETNRLDKQIWKNRENEGKRGDIQAQILQKQNELGFTYDTLKSKIEELEKEQNPFTKQVEILNKSIKTLFKEEEKLKKQLKGLEREREDLLFWHNIYGKDLKLKLFEAACPFLDTRTAYHLSALGNDQIHVEFSTVKRLASGDAKEEFSVRAWSETGGSSYGSLSGGEKKITSFAIGLALADLAASQAAGSTDFMILDEPFEQLDELNSEAIVHYLKDVCIKNTILLVSNEEYLKQLIPNRTHVIKRKGISTIEGSHGTN